MISVEGCMEDSGDDSDSSSESSQSFDEAKYLSVVVEDDEDEEVEVFSSSATSSSNRQQQQQQQQSKALAATESHSQSTDIPPDSFGIQYKRMQVVEDKELDEQLQQLSIVPPRQEPAEPVCDETDEFAVFDVDDLQNQDAIQLAIKVAMKDVDVDPPSFDEFARTSASNSNALSTLTADCGDGFRFGNAPSIDEPLIMNKATESTVKESASQRKQALQDIVDVYASGMGDQEVLLLDVNKKEGQEKMSLSKDLVPISEEEEDECSEDSEKLGNTIDPPEDPQVDEWTNLESIPVIDILEKPLEILSSFDYDDAISYFESLDLSIYEPSIVTSELSKKSFLSSFQGPTKLDFEGSDKLLRLPFLVACVDYDPFCPQHFAMLRTIFSKLLPSGDSSKLQPIDGKWEKLGFQGKDPRTDLNRSMKVLSVLQMLAFISQQPSFAKFMFDLSQSESADSTQRVSGFDASWPFMCVSVMFTKEALQALRAGVLNSVCNKAKSVVKALNEFHQACFGEFCILLRREPLIHHAHHLAKIRALCSKSPLKLVDHFSRGKHKSYMSTTENFSVESLTDLQNIKDTAEPVTTAKSTWFKTSKADKFAV